CRSGWRRTRRTATPALPRASRFAPSTSVAGARAGSGGVVGRDAQRLRRRDPDLAVAHGDAVGADGLGAGAGRGLARADVEGAEMPGAFHGAAIDAALFGERSIAVRAAVVGDVDVAVDEVDGNAVAVGQRAAGDGAFLEFIEAAQAVEIFAHDNSFSEVVN